MIAGAAIASSAAVFTFWRAPRHEPTVAVPAAELDDLESAIAALDTLDAPEPVLVG